MQFRIHRIELLNALTKVSKAVSSKSPLPALTGIKFNVENYRLVLTGSDSDITIQTHIDESENILEIIKEGAIVLSSRYIFEIIRKIDSEFVNFEILDGTLTKITGDSSEFTLNGIKAIDYPKIDLSKNGENFKINAVLLKNIIDQTIFATSDKETRPALTGVNFKSAQGHIECTATDSYRLAKKYIDTNDQLAFNITIPGKSLNEISKIIEKDEDIDIYITDRKILFVLDNAFIQTRLIDGTFPDTSRLIPTSYSYVLNADSRELLSAIDRASLLSTESANIVKLTITQNLVTISSSSQEIGSVEDTITSAIFEGEDLSISFSAKYLTDAIRAIGSNKISIYFTGPMKPFVIKNNSDESIIQLVLPVRTY